jgi:inosine/xanthosine triphosphate pyrophosphatase family protein
MVAAAITRIANAAASAGEVLRAIGEAAVTDDVTMSLLALYGAPGLVSRDDGPVEASFFTAG